MPPSASGDPGAAAAFAALLAASAVVIGIIYRRRELGAPARGPMRFLEHLRELGSRVIRVALVFGYWLVLVTTFRFDPARWHGLPVARPVADLFDNTTAQLYLLLARTSLPSDVRIIVTRPTEALGAQLEVGLMLSAVLTLPALFFEVWAFLSPALKAKERRLLARSIPLAGLLFLAGAVFSYLFLVPLLFQVLYAFAAPLGAERFLAAGALVGMLAVMAAIFGVAFELPLVMAILVRFGLVRPQIYLKYWRHATVAIAVVAAVVTADPTLVSQVIVGSVMLVLYWGGVALSFTVRRPGDDDGRDAPVRA